MTPESRYLLDIAERNAAALVAVDPNITAVLLIGSVARGEADRYSDIDCAVYYREPVAASRFEALRDAALATGGGMHGRGDAESGFVLYAYADGVRCDFAHTTVANWHRDVAAVLERYEADSPYQKVLGGVLEGLPLYGEEVCRQLKEAARAYPDGLAKAMVEAHLRFWPPSVMRYMMAQRGDDLWLRESLLAALNAVIGMLLGVNRVYHWGEIKRQDAFLDRLAVAPPDLRARVRRVPCLPPGDAINEVAALLEETLGLVEAHLPDADVAAARARLGRTLEPWEVPGFDAVS